MPSWEYMGVLWVDGVYLGLDEGFRTYDFLKTGVSPVVVPDVEKVVSGSNAYVLFNLMG